MDWPAVVGIYGAIVATVVAAWTIRIGLRDRGHLQLEVRLKRYEQDRATGEVVEMALDSAAGLRLHLGATNVGRRPIGVDTWQTAGGVMLAQDMTREPIGEAERCTVLAYDIPGLLASTLPRMWVTDSAGRTWQVPRRQLRSVAKQIRFLRTAGQVSK